MARLAYESFTEVQFELWLMGLLALSNRSLIFKQELSWS